MPVERLLDGSARPAATDGFDTETTLLAPYGGAGFTAELTAAAATHDRIPLPTCTPEAARRPFRPSECQHPMR
jgi:hypothetical protein